MKFHLIVILWGDAYIDRFLRLVLPSLLAPANLGAFPDRAGTVCRIFTRREDLPRFAASGNFKRLQALVRVQWRFPEAIAAPEPDRYKSLVACTRTALQEAREEDAILVFLPPDQLCSDGTFPLIARCAAAGKKAVVVAGLRMTQETAEPALARGWPPEGAGTRGYPPRDLVRLALDHLHPLAASCFVDSAAFLNTWPSHLYWRVDRDGFLIRACHLHPLMVDPRGSTALGLDTVDGALLEELCPTPEAVHVVQDSDDMVAVELSRQDQFPPAPPGHANPSLIARFLDAHATPLHLSFLERPIRVHAGDLTPAWQEVERQAERALARVGAYRIRDRYGPAYLEPKVAKLMAAWRQRGSRVLLYGAGEHTARLFQWTGLARAPLVGLADGNPALHGQERHGLRVIAPREIPALRPDVVLISSFFHRDEIYRQLRPLEADGVELAGLYGPLELSRKRILERLCP